MGDVVNMHETIGQVRKAAVLADVLSEANCTADGVLNLVEQDWRNAAQIASERLGRKITPPSDATKTLVWHRLTERERLSSTNPLDGIGLRT